MSTEEIAAICQANEAVKAADSELGKLQVLSCDKLKDLDDRVAAIEAAAVALELRVDTLEGS